MFLIIHSNLQFTKDLQMDTFNYNEGRPWQQIAAPESMKRQQKMALTTAIKIQLIPVVHPKGKRQ